MINPMIDYITPIYPYYRDDEVYTPENEMVNLYAQYLTLLGKPEAWRSVILYDSKLGGLPRATDLCVSTFGRVWNKFSKKFEVQSLLRNIADGYLYVHVRPSDNRSDTRLGLVHRLVMDAFYPNPNRASLLVNHLDEVKSHNWVWNLEWSTYSENTKYSINTKKGIISLKSPITDEQADKIRLLLSSTNLSASEVTEEVKRTMGIIL